MSNLTSNILTSKGSVLIYALPLLFISLSLTFAGAYLTLDRTCSFPTLGDSDDPIVLDIPGGLRGREGFRETGSNLDWEKHPFESNVPKANPRFAQMIKSSRRRANLWKLGGGLGGLLAGYLFGVCAPTILTLYITEHTSRTMTKIPFLIITFISAFVCSILSGKFHTITLIVTCMSGSFSITTFAAFAISLSTTGRLLIWAVMAILMSIAPIFSLFSFTTKTQSALHWSMRVAQSSLGSMGVVFSIAVLARVSGWEDALDALWSTTHPDNGATLALSIMGWLLLILGVGCDWILYRTMGPSKDQSWDNYLSHYLDNLPNRAGRFERLPSFWSRFKSIFHRSHEAVGSSLGSLDEESLPSSLGKIPKNARKRTLKSTPAVRFDLAAGSSDSGSDTNHVPSYKVSKESIFASKSFDDASDVTLLESGSANKKNSYAKDERNWTMDKYETEADITSNLLTPDERLTDWKPGFLLNHSNELMKSYD